MPCKRVAPQLLCEEAPRSLDQAEYTRVQERLRTAAVRGHCHLSRALGLRSTNMAKRKASLAARVRKAWREAVEFWLDFASFCYTSILESLHKATLPVTSRLLSRCAPAWRGGG